MYVCEKKKTNERVLVTDLSSPDLSTHRSLHVTRNDAQTTINRYDSRI